MNNKQVNEVFIDNVTSYGITIKNDDLYLVKNGKSIKLSALIIKEKRGN